MNLERVGAGSKAVSVKVDREGTDGSDREEVH
jgi:hypothetical protein